MSMILPPHEGEGMRLNWKALGTLRILSGTTTDAKDAVDQRSAAPINPITDASPNALTVLPRDAAFAFVVVAAAAADEDAAAGAAEPAAADFEVPAAAAAEVVAAAVAAATEVAPEAGVATAVLTQLR